MDETPIEKLVGPRRRLSDKQEDKLITAMYELTDGLAAVVAQGELQAKANLDFKESTDNRTEALTKSIFWFKVGVVVMVALGALNTWTNHTANDTRNKIVEQQQQITAVQDRIVSCTDPKGQCYQDSAKNSAPIIKTLNDKLDQIIAQQRKSIP